MAGPGCRGGSGYAGDGRGGGGGGYAGDGGRGYGLGHPTGPGRPDPGHRFRPLSARPEQPEDGTGAACRRNEPFPLCDAVAAPRTRAQSPCDRGRTTRILGLAARLGGDCPAQPPPLIALPREGKQ